MTQFFTNFLFPLLAAIGAVIFSWWYCKKPQLRFRYNNIGSVRIPSENPDIISAINMHSITIWNTGRIPLKNIQILHSYDVSFDEKANKGNKNLIATGIYPKVPYSYQDKDKTITFEQLAPQEWVTIHYLYPPPLTFSAIHEFLPNGGPYIRSEQVIAKPLNLVKSLDISPKLQPFFWIFLIIGFWVSMSFLANLFMLVKHYSVGIMCNLW